MHFRTVRVATATFLVWAGLLFPSFAHSTTTFYSQTSGDWSDPATWIRQSGDADEDGLPDEDDTVWILQGHDVTFQGTAPGPTVDVVHIIGSLELPLPTGDTPPSQFGAHRIWVRRHGDFRVFGPHTLTFLGDPSKGLSFVTTLAGSSATLHGHLTLEESTLTAALDEQERSITVEDTTQQWEPEALVGQRITMLSGHARLWSFEITGNTATTLTLSLERAGAQPNKPFPDVTIDPERRDLLYIPPTTIALEPGSHTDRMLHGRWLGWRGDDQSTGHSYVLGGFDSDEAEEPDALVIWPPIPEGIVVEQADLTWRLHAGDRYMISNPLRLTIPDAYHLPAPLEGRYFIVGPKRESVMSMRHIDIGYGAVQLEAIDNSSPDDQFNLDFANIHDVNNSCIVFGVGMANLAFSYLHIRDIHPENETVPFGGRWNAADQRGHGICLTGPNIQLENNLLNNLNDDMIIVIDGSETIIRDNILINTGAFHGNSDEVINLDHSMGTALVEGNIMINAQTALLVDIREAPITVRNNLIVQNTRRAVYRDEGDADSPPVIFENNAILSGRTKTQEPLFIQGQGKPTHLRNNYIRGVQLFNVTLAEHNIIEAPPGMTSLLTNSTNVHSNIVRGALNSEEVLVRIDANFDNIGTVPLTNVVLSNNTFDSSEGFTMSWNSNLPLVFEKNITTNKVFKVLNPAEDADNRSIQHNLAFAEPWVSPDTAWPTLPSDAIGRIEPFVWRDAALYTLPVDAFAIDGADGERIGYIEAGLLNPELLPIPLPGLIKSFDDPDNDQIPNPEDNCPMLANTDQIDFDNDGIGNVCDSSPGEEDVGAEDSGLEDVSGEDGGQDTNTDDISEDSATNDVAIDMPHDTEENDTAIADVEDDTTEPDTNPTDVALDTSDIALDTPVDVEPDTTLDTTNLEDTQTVDTETQPDTERPDTAQPDTENIDTDNPEPDTMITLMHDSGENTASNPASKAQGSGCSTPQNNTPHQNALLLWMVGVVGCALYRRKRKPLS